MEVNLSFTMAECISRILHTYNIIHTFNHFVHKYSYGTLAVIGSIIMIAFVYVCSIIIITDGHIKGEIRNRFNLISYKKE